MFGIAFALELFLLQARRSSVPAATIGVLGRYTWLRALLTYEGRIDRGICGWIIDKHFDQPGRILAKVRKQ